MAAAYELQRRGGGTRGEKCWVVRLAQARLPDTDVAAMVRGSWGWLHSLWAALARDVKQQALLVCEQGRVR